MFRRLEKAEGESIRVLRNLGVIALARGDVKTAEKYLRREREVVRRFVPKASLARRPLLYSLTGGGIQRYAAALATRKRRRRPLKRGLPGGAPRDLQGPVPL
jgi:Flp pilus assembly protein TadD